MTSERTFEQDGQECGPAPERKAKAMALVALAANFDKELPEALFALWLDLLRPYPAAAVDEAVKKVVLTYEYKTLPPFAVIQNALDAACGTGPKNVELQAVAEWGNLLDLIRKHGSHNPPLKVHATTAYVLRIMGGWQAACRWEESGMEFKRRDFIKHWTDCHGNVDAMALGAAGLRPALEVRRDGPRHIGGIRKLIEGGEPLRTVNP